MQVLLLSVPTCGSGAGRVRDVEGQHAQTAAEAQPKPGVANRGPNPLCSEVEPKCVRRGFTHCRTKNRHIRAPAIKCRQDEAPTHWRGSPQMHTYRGGRIAAREPHPSLLSATPHLSGRCQPACPNVMCRARWPQGPAPPMPWGSSYTGGIEGRQTPLQLDDDGHRFTAGGSMCCSDSTSQQSAHPILLGVLTSTPKSGKQEWKSCNKQHV